MPQDITLSSRCIVRPYRSSHSAARITHFQPSTFAASSQAIAYGDIVQFDVNTASNGFRVVKCSTGSSGAVLSTAVVGVALGPDTSDGSTLGLATRQTIPVALGRDDMEFIFPAKCSVAQHQSTCINTDRTVAWDSTLGIFALDFVESTAAKQIVRITDVLDPGSSNGYFVGKFRSTNVSVLTVR
jgi:hypothetical protein